MMRLTKISQQIRYCNQIRKSSSPIHYRYFGDSTNSSRINKTGDVLLMSGGVESSTLLYYLAKQHNQSDLTNTIFPIFANYGQRGHVMELKASKYMCDQFGLKLETIDLNAAGEFFRSRQKLKRHVPIPHRNFVILSLALGYCSELITESSTSPNPITNINLHLGLNKDDLSKNDYNSGTLKFVDAFKTVSNILDPKVTIQTPLVQYTKHDLLHLAQDLQVDLTKTYSCMTGKENHCGHCMQCKSRKEAFKLAGISEPTDFYK